MPEATPPAAPPAAAPAPAATAAAEASSVPVDFQARAAEVLRASSPEAPAAPPAPVAAAAAAPSEAPKAPPAVAEPFAAKFAQIAEADKRFRAEKDAHKLQVKEAAAELAAQHAALAQLKAAKEAANPIAALEALGFTYEQATDQVLGKYQPKGKPAPEGPQVDPKVAALEKEVQQLRHERQQEKNAQVEAAFRSSLVERAKATPEKYELVDATDSYDDAMSLVRAYANAHGELPGGSPEAAMEMALEHVEKQLEAKLLSERVLTAGKLRSRLGAAGEVPKPAVARPQATSAKSPPSSLSNSLASAAPPRTAKPEPRTKEDFIALAAEVLRGDAG